MFFKKIFKVQKLEKILPNELNKALKTQEPTVLLDVRTPQEFKSRHIPGAVNIDFFNASFEQKASKLNKDKKYYLICQSGARSKMACKKLKKMGFNNVVNVSGGMAAWVG